MKIFNSFSGGKSSALMSKILKEKYPDAEIVSVFANTGQEHDKTLEFVDKCDKYFNLNVVYVEAVVNFEKGVGTTHKVVDFETATRDGSLFDDMCKKYGIANKSYPHCTRELKLQPMYSYIKSIGWNKKDFQTAIGIRSDEMDRINPNYKEKNYLYPLMDEGITKEMVNDFWSKQSFNLEIPERLGNCTWCWKKSLKKHQRLIKEMPEIFDVPRELELKYGSTNNKGDPRVFFREKRSTQELFKKATEQLDLLDNFDQSWGCEESCEAII